MRLYLTPLNICLIITTLTNFGECLRYDTYDQPCLTDVGSDDDSRSPAPAPSPSPSHSMNFSEEPVPDNSSVDPPMHSPIGVSKFGLLQVGFYNGKCKVNVETIIANQVKAQFEIDPTLLPALLRLQFHDCFIHGCDASILIDGASTEKTGSPNKSVTGYVFIDDLKGVVEEQCPGVVSCADIIAIATKVLIKLGGGADYPVQTPLQTGRRDGLVSRANDTLILPSPFLSVENAITAFNAKNFTAAEMVGLLGCHTVGIAHCGFIRDRLYPGTKQFDPLMDPSLRDKLMTICPQNSMSNNFTFLDQNPQSSNVMDNSYFTQIVNQRGVLPIDQELAADPRTQGFVQQLSLNATLFSIELANAMVKMQALDVLTGNQGEVRKVCRKFN